MVESSRDQNDDDDFILKYILLGNKPTKNYEIANAQSNLSGDHVSWMC